MTKKHIGRHIGLITLLIAAIANSACSHSQENSASVALDARGGATISLITIEQVDKRQCALGEIPFMYLGDIVLETDNPSYFGLEDGIYQNPDFASEVRVSRENVLFHKFTYSATDTDTVYEQKEGKGSLKVRVKKLEAMEGLDTLSLAVSHPGGFHISDIRSSHWNKPWIYCADYNVSRKKAAINRNQTGLVDESKLNEDEKNDIYNYEKPAQWRITVDFPEVCDSRERQIVESAHVGVWQNSALYQSTHDTNHKVSGRAQFVNGNQILENRALHERIDMPQVLDSYGVAGWRTSYRATSQLGGGVKQIYVLLDQITAGEFATIYDESMSDDELKEFISFESHCIPSWSITTE